MHSEIAYFVKDFAYSVKALKFSQLKRLQPSNENHIYG